MKKYREIKDPEFIIKVAKKWEDMWAEVHISNEDAFVEFVVDNWCEWWASLLDSMELDKEMKETILTWWCQNIWKIIAEL